MAKAKSVPGYAITVSGEYYCKDPNTGVKSVKFYKDHTFELPEIVSYVEGREEIEKVVNGRAVKTTKPKVIKGNSSRCGLHIIRRYYIESKLKETIPGFTGVKTCEIFKRERIKMAPPKAMTPKEINNMHESELNQFVMINDLNISLTQYHGLDTKKDAVIRAYNQKQKDDIAAGKTEAMSQEEANLLPADGIVDDGGAEDLLGDLG